MKLRCCSRADFRKKSLPHILFKICFLVIPINENQRNNLKIYYVNESNTKRCIKGCSIKFNTT